MTKNKAKRARNSFQIDVPLPKAGGLFGHLEWGAMVDHVAMETAAGPLVGDVHITLLAHGHDDRNLDLSRLAQVAADMLAIEFFIESAEAVTGVIVGQDCNLKTGTARIIVEENNHSSSRETQLAVVATVH